MYLYHQHLPRNSRKLIYSGSWHLSLKISNGKEFAKDLERIESPENSDSETNVADTSFVSNGSTLVDNSTQILCGFKGCLNLSVASRMYRVHKQKQEKQWRKIHKWCSRCYDYGLAGRCVYSAQIDAVTISR
jgi:hypothetical protein